jgi:6-phosphogluconolactonase
VVQPFEAVGEVGARRSFDSDTRWLAQRTYGHQGEATMPHSLLIGTYTEKLPHVEGKGGGVLTAGFTDGIVGQVSVAAVVANPSWLTSTADGRFVYTVAETVEFNGHPGGGVAAYSRDVLTGALTLLNTAPSGGTEPAHLELDPSGRFVLVANYGTGSVAVFVLRADGGLGPMVDRVDHDGRGTHPVRQTAPHPHQIVFDPVTGQMLVPDLGMDAVLLYTLDEAGRLSELRDHRVDVESGAGPRHLAFHPDGQHLFLVNELDSTLVVLKRGRGGFEVTDLRSTLPEGFTGHNQAGEVRVAASGEFVYVSNRGSDSISMFSFEAAAGTVELRAQEWTRGRGPRDFIETPDGSRLLVANQDTDSIISFAVDEAEPSLRYASSTRALTPVCLRLVPTASPSPSPS